MTPAGFPHSDISGSKPVSGSPKLFAAYHVLHRLSLPRHPPYALSSLTIKNCTISAKPAYYSLRATCSPEHAPVKFLPTSLLHYAIVKEQHFKDEGGRIKDEFLPCAFILQPYLLVEVNGFEPMTSCVQGRRSPS